MEASDAQPRSELDQRLDKYRGGDDCFISSEYAFPTAFGRLFEVGYVTTIPGQDCYFVATEEGITRLDGDQYVELSNGDGLPEDYAEWEVPEKNRDQYFWFFMNGVKIHDALRKAQQESKKQTKTATELQTEVTRLSKQVSELAEAASGSAKQSELFKARQEASNTKRELEKVQKALEAASKNRAAASEKVKALEKQIEVFKKQVADALQGKADAEALTEQVREQLTAEQTAHGETQAALEKAQSDLDILLAQIGDDIPLDKAFQLDALMAKIADTEVESDNDFGGPNSVKFMSGVNLELMLKPAQPSPETAENLRRPNKGCVKELTQSVLDVVTPEQREALNTLCEARRVFRFRNGSQECVVAFLGLGRKPEVVTMTPGGDGFSGAAAKQIQLLEQVEDPIEKQVICLVLCIQTEYSIPKLLQALTDPEEEVEEEVATAKPPAGAPAQSPQAAAPPAEFQPAQPDGEPDTVPEPEEIESPFPEPEKEFTEADRPEQEAAVKVFMEAQKGKHLGTYSLESLIEEFGDEFEESDVEYATKRFELSDAIICRWFQPETSIGFVVINQEIHVYDIIVGPDWDELEKHVPEVPCNKPDGVVDPAVHDMSSAAIARARGCSFAEAQEMCTYDGFLEALQQDETVSIESHSHEEFETVLQGPSWLRNKIPQVRKLLANERYHNTFLLQSNTLPPYIVVTPSQVFVIQPRENIEHYYRRMINVFEIMDIPSGKSPLKNAIQALVRGMKDGRFNLKTDEETGAEADRAAIVADLDELSKGGTVEKFSHAAVNAAVVKNPSTQHFRKGVKATLEYKKFTYIDGDETECPAYYIVITDTHLYICRNLSEEFRRRLADSEHFDLTMPKTMNDRKNQFVQGRITLQQWALDLQPPLPDGDNGEDKKVEKEDKLTIADIEAWEEVETCTAATLRERLKAKLEPPIPVQVYKLLSGMIDVKVRGKKQKTPIFPLTSYYRIGQTGIVLIKVEKDKFLLSSSISPEHMSDLETRSDLTPIPTKITAFKENNGEVPNPKIAQLTGNEVKWNAAMARIGQHVAAGDFFDTEEFTAPTQSMIQTEAAKGNTSTIEHSEAAKIIGKQIPENVGVQWGSVLGMFSDPLLYYSYYEPGDGSVVVIMPDELIVFESPTEEVRTNLTSSLHCLTDIFNTEGLTADQVARCVCENIAKVGLNGSEE